MLNIDQQIESCRLVCPVTHEPLIARNDHLETPDGKHRYPLVNAVPILISHGEKQLRYVNKGGGCMAQGRREVNPVWRRTRSFLRRLTTVGGAYRSEESLQAFRQVVAEQPPEALCLSVGGGPSRAHPNLVNLNIGLFPNVDVVADAHELPYPVVSVDAIHCDAVLEHLESPDRAVAEMWRVLKRGGQVFAATPFLQRYHGDPSHFQNFTLTGHQRLFECAGFSIVSSGVCVGPTAALSTLIITYAQHYTPTKVLKFLTAGLAVLLALPLRSLDLWINKTSAAHKLASTTYVHAIKTSD